MGVDADFAGILREIVQFLESLCDVDLPTKIENAKENLLHKSKTRLAILTTNRSSTSPEPYLDMNAGKGLLLFPNKSVKDIEIQEYVGVEEKKPTRVTSLHQDYYEAFQEFGGNRTDGFNKLGARDDEAEDKLRGIYKSFSPAVTMDKAHKSGPLYHKVERKPFGFVRGNVRSCWIGLVGSHLLIYGSKDDKQQPEIYSIRGYTARPAANSMPKDPERAKSAFEIFCPGNKTFQFIARTPEEMEEWLSAISRTSTEVQGRNPNKEQPIRNSVSLDEQYQDVNIPLSNSTIIDEPVTLRTTSPILDSSIVTKLIRSDSKKKKEVSPILSISPPTLPVRQPRRLPSLPNEEALAPSYERMDYAYEDDDIYHKIEDIRDKGRSYENVKNIFMNPSRIKRFTKKDKKKKKKEEKKIPDVQIHDCVENKVQLKKEETKKKTESSSSPEVLETYDDVQTIVQEVPSPLINSRSTRRELLESFEETTHENDEPFQTYDDVFTTKGENVETQDAEETSTGSPKKEKSPQKRSFLNRVMHKKDSFKNEEGKKKRLKDNVSSKKREKPVKSSVVGEDCEFNLPTYDDVSEQNTENANVGRTTMISSCLIDDFSNYNCPPPPRAIYAKPPSLVVPVTNQRVNFEEVYDDIANYRDDRNEDKMDQKSVETKAVEIDNQSTDNNNSIVEDKGSTAMRLSVIIDEELDKRFPVDFEHYQTPRRDSILVNNSVLTLHQQDELYDDIAILANFRGSARKRDSVCSSGSNGPCNSSSTISVGDKSTISIKKPWSKFSSGKKNNRDSTAVESTTMTNNSCPELDEVCEMTGSLPANSEKHDGMLNKVQKLISKMECTLGKQPVVKSVE